jgi:hypothetical protein
LRHGPEPTKVLVSKGVDFEKGFGFEKFWFEKFGFEKF